MKIYVVIGSHGEYSDKTEYLVKAFDEELSARVFVDEVSGASRVFQQKYSLAQWTASDEEELQLWKQSDLYKLDPELIEVHKNNEGTEYVAMWSVDLYTINYRIEEVELVQS